MRPIQYNNSMFMKTCHNPRCVNMWDSTLHGWLANTSVHHDVARVLALA